jgi:uncharacterized membrane protein
MSDGGDQEDVGLLEDPEALFTSLWVVVGVLLLWTGRRTYGLLDGAGWVGALLVTQLFVSGIAIVVVATAGLVDLRRWSRPLAAWVIYQLGAVGVFTYLSLPPYFFASDITLFESWAAHLVATGRNPMTESMLVAREAWPVANSSANITATQSGGVVSSYSYPGGTLLVSTLEQLLMPGNRLGLSTLVVSVAGLVWLVRRVDVALVPLALIAWLAPVVRPASAALGLITPLWLVPLMIGLGAWYDRRLRVAGVAVGVAAASKQLAWPVAGLVLVHIFRTGGLRGAARFAKPALATVLALVGWLVLWDPAAWTFSAFFPFLPIGEPLVAQGVGLTSPTVAGVLEVPRALHRALVLAVAGGLVVATWRYPNRMRWVVPFATILVMLLHYRTLPSYYAAAVPLAVVALDTRLRGLDALPAPASVDADGVVGTPLGELERNTRGQICYTRPRLLDLLLFVVALSLFVWVIRYWGIV